MPIHIRDSADPLSERARESISYVINAESDAGRLLRHELERYCDRQISGRSFVIAGHRGAGKTTMVGDAIARVTWDNRDRQRATRPMEVMLHGPTLLQPLPSDEQDDKYPRDPKEVPALSTAEERQAEVALTHIILGLQRAVVREFAIAYRDKMRQAAEGSSKARSVELGELAAQFEIELLENPPAARLREFWQHAESLGGGILFDAGTSDDQGARELVALNGMCNAHQRISGDISERSETKQNSLRKAGTSRGFDLKAVEALKPLGAVFAGSVVAGGAAAGGMAANPSDLGIAAAFGLFTALATGMFLKNTNETSSRRTRQLDRIFIPDLSLRTLDRVLPTLIERLRRAGLAPVLIIDELDKVEHLCPRMEKMVDYLKKLVTENVFTCLLTDRGYIEYLRSDEQEPRYSRTHSYFSHSLLVAYWPAELDAYLSRLLYVNGAASVERTNLSGDALDCELLKWVLRHRSQLNALQLSREVAGLRGADGQVQITPGQLRTGDADRIDITLQVAIDMQLAKSAEWLRSRPRMLQTLLDALYYFSRHRREEVDLTDKGNEKFLTYLRKRMDVEKLGRHVKSLGTEEQSYLTGLLSDMVRFLCESYQPAQFKDEWRDAAGNPGVTVPQSEVINALLLGEKSLLVTDPNNRKIFHWRHQEGPRPFQGPALSVVSLPPTAPAAMEFIENVGRNLSRALWPDGTRDDKPDGHIYAILSDDRRVLKTSPAWSRVHAAIRNLELVQRGQGDVEQIDSNCRAIDEFKSLLTDSAKTLRTVLRMAALLSAISAAGTKLIDRHAALKILADGLGFARLSPEAVGSSVERLCLSLLQQMSALPVAEQEPVPDLLGREWIDELAKWSKASANTEFDWAACALSAWASWQSRLDVWVERGVTQEASACEWLSAARGVGPSQFFGTVDIGSIGLSTWTDVVLSMGAKIESERAPHWLLPFAMRALGGCSLERTAAEHLLREIASLGGASNDEIDNLQTVAARLGVGGGGYSRIAIALRGFITSLTWVSQPTLGFVVVVGRMRLLREEKILRAIAGTVRMVKVAWEQPFDSVNAQERVMKGLSSVSNAKIESLYLYAVQVPNMQAPYIVAPDSADALFRSG